MHKVCEGVGLPIDPAKDEGPATTIAFTGIEIYSDTMETQLPKIKLDRLNVATLPKWCGRAEPF